MITNTNLRAVQPIVLETILEVEINTFISGRQALTHNESGSDVSSISLPWTPTTKYWVEVYVDGFRLINTSTDFDHTFAEFEVNGRTITFSEPVSGDILVVCDAITCPPYEDVNVVSVENEQGAKSLTAGLFVASHCEPIILTQPEHGFARLTDDRMSILYIPNVGYTGPDAFSYSVFTQRGQLANPKCVQIQVGPLPSEEEEEQ